MPHKEAAIWHGKKPEREANEKLRKGLIRELGSGKPAVQIGGYGTNEPERSRALRRLAGCAYFAHSAGAVLAGDLSGVSKD